MSNFPSTDIFGYQFVDFWKTEYIFEYSFINSWKFEYIWTLAKKPSFNICNLFLMKKSKFRYTFCINQWWVWIFEYSNKMTLEYYLYSYSCYFQSTNIFGYLFGKYVASKNIRIFIRYITWHPNIYWIFVCVHFIIFAHHWLGWLKFVTWVALHLQELEFTLRINKGGHF